MLSSTVYLPYNRDAHAPFVLGTFLDTITDVPPWCQSDVREHRKVLERQLRDPRAKTLVAAPRGHEDQLLGWAAARDGVLIFAYVREVVRRAGLFRMLVAALGLLPPLSVAYWTPDCTRMAQCGSSLYFDVLAYERMTQEVR